MNLLNLSPNELTEFLARYDEPSFRATQILKWIYQQGVSDFEGMSNVSKATRAKLSEVCFIETPRFAYEHTALDGTIKWLMALGDGNSVESVFIPEDDRGTLCISSQVGCVLNCDFCSTGKQGFHRHLQAFEIIGQVWRANERLKILYPEPDAHPLGLRGRVTNVVFMGMGEPLLNFDAVTTACDVMLDERCFGLSKRRVTLSTAGVVPMMPLLAERTPVSLAVSLHAATDELRDVLVPINKKYPLAVLKKVCREYFPKASRRRIMFEYVMLQGVNDQPQHAKALVKWLEGVPAKVNLIPFNPFQHAPYRCSEKSVIENFREYLLRAGIHSTVRKTRGDDIQAACGQLVGVVQDKTRRQVQWKARVSAHEST